MSAFEITRFTGKNTYFSALSDKIIVILFTTKDNVRPAVVLSGLPQLSDTGFVLTLVKFHFGAAMQGNLTQ
jgi:hypothetical protein